ncbi:NTF2-like protein [Macrolepiota fuliginosa MF-IS2]|uniref:NTF2-like protein n=1 Tax=Macrolepiota fuliginosa MF-IS2 TaxID=1400762 RepID=A0A9P6C1N9_9AGAR|nr:NTF2-like protein [Macrolepiota fuliginosa MF-IS2]
MPVSHSGPSDPLSIRGAARPTLAGRLRRKDGEPNMLPKQSTVDAWRKLVNKRYDPNTRFLNLESVIDDEIVKKHSLTPPGYGGDSRTAAVIFKLAGQLKPEVQTLSLANNNLSGMHLIYLDRYLPKLRNLSLQGNALKTWRDLDPVGARRDKMKHLRELVLVGTPLRDMEYKNGRGDRYRGEIARRFLALEVLDSEAITQIGFTNDSGPGPTPVVPKPSATTFPFEMGPSFITGVDGVLVSSFLFRFFQLFDTQRGGLLDVYDPQANFSYCCNTNIPARARIENLHNTLPNQRKLLWDLWLNNSGGGSRNLNRPQVSVDKMVEVLHTGPAKIVTAQTALPETKHDVQGAMHKFVVDAFPVPHGQGNALLLTLHGEFMEVRSQGLRSFDRSFILLPAAEGSRAKLAGWDVVILSDQLTIRGYSNSNAWKAGPLLVQAEDKSKSAQKSVEFSVSSLPLIQQQALNTLPEAQKNLALQICAQTRLNVNYAVECLNGNAWDLERATANFEQSLSPHPCLPSISHYTPGHLYSILFKIYTYKHIAAKVSLITPYHPFPKLDYLLLEWHAKVVGEE